MTPHRDRDASPAAGHGHTHGQGAGGGLRHGGGRWRRLVHRHGHDGADRVDGALEGSRRGTRAVTLSCAGLLVTAAVQAAVVAVSGSVALAADTVHNAADALTAVPLLLAFRLGRRPPDRRYTYGYRRAEDLAGLAVLAVVALSAAAAGWQAVDRLVHPRAVEHVGVVLLAGLVGFAGNEAVARYRTRVGEAIGSAALVADGLHARTDGLTSLAVALGAAGTWAGVARADPIVGLVVAVAVLGVLRDAARRVVRRLMDAVDPAVVDHVEAVAAGTEGVHGVGTTRVRWLGHRLVADVAIVVAGDLAVRDGHARAEAVRHRLRRAVPHLDEVHVHVDPDDRDAHRDPDPLGTAPPPVRPLRG